MDKKWIVIVIILVVIWASLAWYFVSYGEDVSRDPCSVCSERMGEDITCMSNARKLSPITFYSNGSIEK